MSHSLSAVIRRRREELGLSQEELAERVAAQGDRAFRQSDVSRLERGIVDLPRGRRLLCLATALDLPAGELLARSGWVGSEVAFASEAAGASHARREPRPIFGPSQSAAWRSRRSPFPVR